MSKINKPKGEVIRIPDPPLSPPLRQCNSCHHWLSKIFECHRYAPVPVVLGEIGMQTNVRARMVAWPVTSGSDHCGEWEQAK